MKRLIVVLMAVILLSGCGSDNTHRVNILPRPTYILSYDGDVVGVQCWLMPFEGYETDMEFKGFVNAYNDRCQGWIRK